MAYRYSSKKPIRSFQDLEVYQKTLQCAVLAGKDLRPKLDKLKYLLAENFFNCALSIPLWLAEAHSQRFGDKARAIALVEQAMAGCNKMVVYLEQIKGIYGDKAEPVLIDDLVGRYLEARRKCFRLQRSWREWDDTAHFHKPGGVSRPPL